jgi:imidazolonepropionase-like amidohydrolase
MEEKRNLDQDDVLDLIGKFPLQPRFNGVYVTVNSVETYSNLDISDTVLNEVQYVVAVGPVVTDLKPGQKVILDIEKMMVDVMSETKNSYESVKQVKIDLVEVNGSAFALVNDRVIKVIDHR